MQVTGLGAEQGRVEHIQQKCQHINRCHLKCVVTSTIQILNTLEIWVCVATVGGVR